ncbi:MAG: PAS domain-containing protein [Gemmatimonadota bacterium]|jgi:PAS domain S-box-containing protein|nr:PAS domain-containing protein [Gemmatimonadota bacterium]MDP6528073.1 PAS domain-containing protein [Gemmatimonadota bacterium]MDP6801553.1 PAS domain-containing protein [Gemmatimonadota bacterium]MDP7030900.1 PAS domain-containing protein [Gemmatimonadota bacterium]
MDSAKPWSAGQSLHGQELEALRESEERLKLALAGSDEGVWDWNIVTGDVHFSRRWMEMLEYLPGELEGNVSTWEKLVHPDDMPMVMAVLQKHLDGETPFYETEHRLLTKSGEWKWILDRGKVMERDADGNAVRAPSRSAHWLADSSRPRLAASACCTTLQAQGSGNATTTTASFEAHPR